MTILRSEGDEALPEGGNCAILHSSVRRFIIYALVHTYFHYKMIRIRWRFPRMSCLPFDCVRFVLLFLRPFSIPGICEEDIDLHEEQITI